MAEKKNALAELAERFAKGTITVKDIDCAGRIVAELAKVNGKCWNPLKNGQCSYFCYATDSRIQCVVCKCRKIAEEGAGDGKL